MAGWCPFQWQASSAALDEAHERADEARAAQRGTEAALAAERARLADEVARRQELERVGHAGVWRVVSEVVRQGGHERKVGAQLLDLARLIAKVHSGSTFVRLLTCTALHFPTDVRGGSSLSVHATTLKCT